jgi:putative PIN family toxin of toxin-antitoxin system
MFGGLPGALLDLVFLQSFVTVISPDLLDELDEKLRLKFDVSPEDAATVLDRIAGIAQVVHPEETLQVIREDPDHDQVLECAVSGKANYIVTGDRHLLRLGEYRGIRIMRVREFLDSIEQEPNE